MSFQFDENVSNLIKELIGKITKFQEDSDIFQHVYKYVDHQLLASDSMFFITNKEIEKKVESLAEKFIFHGFLKQSADLKILFEKYVNNNLHKDEIKNRLIVMQLLFSMSESPTRNLENQPEAYKSLLLETEEKIDWASYLREGIERWTPPSSTHSDDSSDPDMSISNLDEIPSTSTASPSLLHTDYPDSGKSNENQTYVQKREKLMSSIQHTWFNRDFIQMIPPSTNVDANVAIEWEDYLYNSMHGLFDTPKSTILSEYKIIREVIWQLWDPHDSVGFKLSGAQLVPRENVTIASLRQPAFWQFLHIFLPYINMMEEFRDFENTVNAQPSDPNIPSTYTCYSYSQKIILEPTIKALIDLEIEIMKQETTWTLIKLSVTFRNLFKTANILREIHKNVIMDYKATSNFECAANLLDKLHKGLNNPVSKEEQDVYLCLYLESLFKYVCVIEDWLKNDDFNDYCNEFPIFCTKTQEEKRRSFIFVCNSDVKNFHEDWQRDFQWQNFDKHSLTDGFLEIIPNLVLHFAKQIHLLRILGKFHLLQPSNTESLYEEFINKVLAEISRYFPEEAPIVNEPDLQDEGCAVLPGEKIKFPAICEDFCKYPTEMDRLENLVDTSDGFLMEAFKSFFIEQPKSAEKPKESLYERICKLTKFMFPTELIIERVFITILKERYGELGKTLKNIFKEDYKLDKHFEVMQNIFLFKDNLIFPFCKRVFKKINKSGTWGNVIWLTSCLQDNLMDDHPEFYDKVIVAVQNNCDDFFFSLKTRTIVKFDIVFPVNIIIKARTIELYDEMFYFILQIKWALYTLNHLYFSDIEPIKRGKKPIEESLKILQSRLKCLRFGLINVFSSIQFYILGTAFNIHHSQFIKDFDKANDLDTLIEAHNVFVTNLHRKICTDLSDGNVFNLLQMVRKLRFMWNNLSEIDDGKLKECNDDFKRCHENILDIISA